MIYYHENDKMEKKIVKTLCLLFLQLVEILSQAVITETRLLQTSNIGIHHLSRKLLIEDAYQFLLKDINSESLDSR